MQLAWTESALSDLSFEQTWATSWNILSIESYSKFIEKLLEDDADIKSLYYQCDMFTLKTVISYSIEIGQPICNIFRYENNNLSKIDVNDEMNENLHSLLFINSDDQFYNSLSRIMKNDDLSKSVTFRVNFLR